MRALARATPYMNIEKGKLMNSFSNAQFNYSPLIWMLYSRCNNNEIKYLNERCLRLLLRQDIILLRIAKKIWVSLYPPQKHTKSSNRDV